MQYLPNSSTICLEYDEFVPAIMKPANYDVSKHRGKITVHGRGGNGSQVLIEYETLPAKYKALVQEQYGNPYHYHARQPLLRMVKEDPAARAYYAAYVLSDGRYLPAEAQGKYTRAAEWLNMIITVTGDKRALKQELRITMEEFWQAALDLIGADRIPNGLPTTRRRLDERLATYKAQGYAGLVDKKWGNQNTRKVNPKIERLILALYCRQADVVKPHMVDVVNDYNAFMTGALHLVDVSTGEVFRPEDYYVDGQPYELSEATVRYYINRPLNRAVVDKVRMSALQYAQAHKPFMQRLAPRFAFSKITMDDTSSPFKMLNGVRPATYKVFDVASQALICMVMHRAARPDADMVRRLLAEMLGLIVSSGWVMPYEIEVENALTSAMTGKDDAAGNLQADVLTAGAVFPFVRFCAPRNPQEKDAEGFIRLFKQTHQQHVTGFQHRPFARGEVNRLNDDSKSTKARYTFEQIVELEMGQREEWNNALHPNQELYPGMTRWQVLEQCQNLELQPVNLAAVMPFVGRSVKTSYRRGYVQVQYNDYRLDEIGTLAALDGEKLTAYYLPQADGHIPEVYLYQDGRYICAAPQVAKFQKAKAEQTDEDLRLLGRQKKYIDGHDAATDDLLSQLPQVAAVRSARAQEVVAHYTGQWIREDVAAEAEAEGVASPWPPPREGVLAGNHAENAQKEQENTANEGGYLHNSAPAHHWWSDPEALKTRALKGI